jgi:glycine/D-amino acid oxidase-like deaminating enzyme
MATFGPEYSDFSAWIDPPAERRPPLDENVRCDVAVVGGGYTGMAAAIRLAERGADVVLLEASFCGWGASSRNAGHLTPTIAGDPQLLATVYRRRAGALVGFSDAAVHFVEDLIERRAIDCDYEPVGNVSAALSRGQLRRAERIARMLAGAGGEVEFVEGAAFGLPKRFLGGILEKAGGVLNPGKFARALRGALLESRARVYEESAVEAIEPGTGGVVLRTARGRVMAERVLLATNAYTRDVAVAPRRVVAPLWVTLAETERIEPDRIEAAGWTSRAGLYTQHMILESYRLTRDSTIVYGSRNVQPPPRSPLHARKPDAAVVDDITRGFHDRFPSLRDVKPQRAWGGWIAMTPSWIPVAGEAAPGVFYTVGYNGHGLAQAPYLGTLMADRLAGDEPHDHLKVVWRGRSRYFPAPLMTGPGVRTGWAIDRITDRLIARLPE